MNAKPITSMLLAAFGAALLATCVGAASGATTSRATARVAPLTTIRTDVNHWLAHAGFKGFTVGEVMAFSNNDYAAVNDKTGKPAFELLLSPTGSWVMEEPVSMMWNTTYGMARSASAGYGGMMGGYGMMGSGSGMMGGSSDWYSTGAGKVTSLTQAVTVANAWLLKNSSRQKAETDGRAFPGYFTLDTTLNGKTAGMLSVNATTGTVWYHGWHGTFVGEKMFAA